MIWLLPTRLEAKNKHTTILHTRLCLLTNENANNLGGICQVLWSPNHQTNLFKGKGGSKDAWQKKSRPCDREVGAQALLIVPRHCLRALLCYPKGLFEVRIAMALPRFLLRKHLLPNVFQAVPYIMTLYFRLLIEESEKKIEVIVLIKRKNKIYKREFRQPLLWYLKRDLKRIWCSLRNKGEFSLRNLLKNLHYDQNL